MNFNFLQKILPRMYSMLPFYLKPEVSLPPFQAFFEVTYRCNLRCDMCHFLEIIEETETKKTYKNELTSAEVKKAIDALPRFTVITFTGGEAFMKSDFLEILEYAVSRNKVHVITNGTFLSEQLVERLMGMRLRSILGAGLFYLGVSLEGHEELHDRITTIPGSFRKSTEGLECLMLRRQELGCKYPLVHVTCVINRDNVMDLVPLYEYANDLGVNVCNFVLSNPATYWHGKDYDQDDRLMSPTPPVAQIPAELLREELARLEDRSKTFNTKLRYSPNYITAEEIVRYYSNQSSYRNYRCYIPWSKVAISAYGDVFSCPHYRLGEMDAEKKSLPWDGERAKSFRTLLKQEKIFPGCLGCCQSEYVGPRGAQPIPQKVETRVKFSKARLQDRILAPINRDINDSSG